MVGERVVNQSGQPDRAPAVVSTASLSPSPAAAPPPDAIYDAPLARRYHRGQRLLSMGRALLAAAFTLAMVLTGYSTSLETVARRVSQSDYIVLLVFLLLFGALEGLLTFPLRVVSSHVLDRRYRLSNQSFGAWLWESSKGALVGAGVGIPLVLGLYGSLKAFGALWWAPVGGLVFLFTVALARLAPILIFPLFYTFEPVKEKGLRERLTALCERVGMPIQGVFVFNMSKTTKKANAAFTGLGRSKRIILADTLVANFTDEEIETVFAHELGHSKLGHLGVLLLAGFLSTFVGLAACAVAFDALLPLVGFPDRTAIAGLPLLGLLLSVYSVVTSPLVNMLSRSQELAADRYGVRLTGRPQDFVNALRKLASVNLAELQPPRLIEVLFHSHPSLERRIQLIERSDQAP